MKRVFYLLPSLLFVLSFPLSASASLNLILPTRNHNLYEHPENFYMQTARSGEDAWKGGMYGFSRDAKNVSGGTVNTRFHEGMDIAPLMRDERGDPLDTVMAIDEGTVVYVNARAGASNYGKYIIVRHYWGGSPFYSLYAHLNETWVDSGQELRQGTPIGRLGYTGDGINRARAHLHFEIAMLVNENFQKWYDTEFGDGANQHSFYNGLNLAGLNVARLYERLKSEPNLTIRQFLETEHTHFYTVLLPRIGRLDILARYPWLLKKSAMPDDPTWEIAFDASGVPLAINPSKKVVKGPTLSWIAESPFPYSYLTKSFTRGEKGKGSLTASGERFMRLVAIEQDSTAVTIVPTTTIAAKGTKSTKGGKREKGTKQREEIAEEEIAAAAGDDAETTDGTGAAADAAMGTEIGTDGVTGEARETPSKTIDEEEGEPEEKGTMAEPAEEITADEGNADEAANAETTTATTADMGEVREEGSEGVKEEAAEESPAPEQTKEAAKSMPPASPVVTAPGKGPEAPDDVLISPYHTDGFFFVWRLNGKRWEVELQPVVLSVSPEGKSSITNPVDTVMARCDECAKYGIAQPRMVRMVGEDTEWKMWMGVADKKKLAARAREANGKIFPIELYIKAGKEESVSTVKVRTAVAIEGSEILGAGGEKE